MPLLEAMPKGKDQIAESGQSISPHPFKNDLAKKYAQCKIAVRLVILLIHTCINIVDHALQGVSG